MSQNNNYPEVWSINAPPLNVLQSNQQFIELVEHYMRQKHKYEKVSSAYEAAHLEALHLELDPTSTQEQLDAAAEREQALYVESADLQHQLNQILASAGMSELELRTRHRNLVKNVTFAANPRYKNLRAALADLYPNADISNSNMEALLRGNVNIPNNSVTNTPNTLAKKSRARAAVAQTRSGGRRRVRRTRKSRRSARKY